MPNGFYRPENVAAALGVELRSMARWRLRENKDKPWYLPAHPDPKDKRRVLYTLDDIEAFALRNPRYADRLRANLARTPAKYIQLLQEVNHG